MHRRRGLGHGPLVYGLWPPRECGDDLDVRGRAQLSRRRPLLAGGGQAQGRDLLHRPHGASRPDARGRCAGEGLFARLAASARHGGRADQPRGLALVSRGGRRRPLPHRGHLVADRDGRSSDHPPARRHRPEARIGDPAPARRRASDRGCRGPAAGGRRLRQSVHHRQLAGPDAHRLWRRSALLRHLFLDLSGPVLHRRRLPSGRGRLLLDHRPGGRRHQCLRPPDGHGRGRERARSARRCRRGGGRRLSPRHQGPGHLRLCHPEQRGRGDRGSEEGPGGPRPSRDRPYRRP